MVPILDYTICKDFLKSFGRHIASELQNLKHLYFRNCDPNFEGVASSLMLEEFVTLKDGKLSKRIIHTNKISSQGCRRSV